MKEDWRSHFFRLFIFLSLIVFVTIATFCYIETNVRIKSIVRLAKSTINNGEHVFHKIINDNISDILFLKEQVLTDYYDHHQSISPDFIKHLEKTFSIFSKQRGIHDQARFIDQHGEEIIRVNYRKGEPRIVPKRELQNKKHRYYFVKSMLLQNNETYFSPLDLNIEHKQIEYPFLPMIRISTPIFSKKGKELGIVILNYKAEELLDRLKHESHSIPGNLLLINQDGHFLLASKPNYEWGNMLPSRKNMTVAKLYPAFWKKLNRIHKNTIYTKKGIFLVKNITSSLPALRFGDLKLKLIWHATWQELIPSTLTYYLLTLLLLWGAAFFASWLWATLKTSQAKHERDLEFLATIDPLTNIANRRELFRVGALEFDRAKRFNQPFSVLMVDIDHFKKVNDTYGHLEGDKGLIAVAKAFNSAIRKIDFVARFGGEEFVIILPETQIGPAKTLAEKLRQQIAKIEIPIDGTYYSFTVSIGVSTWNERDSNIDSVIDHADENLYKAKQAGRNRVVAEE